MVFELDNINRRILFELDRNARITETKLAKLINRSKESVRYRIKQLEEQKIINGYTTWFDPTIVGTTSGKIYLNLSNKPKEKEMFLNQLKKDKRVFWLGVAEGAWNIGVSFYIKSPKEFFDLKNELISKYQNIIQDIKTVSLVEVYISDKTFLYPQENKWITLLSNPKRTTFSENEKKVLNQLIINARQSMTQMARNTNLTIDIIRNNIKKLEQEKIIIKYAANINFINLGYEFFKTFLYFKNFDKHTELRFMEFIKNHPNIIHLVKQISPWDVELEIMCENYNQYDNIINWVTEKFSDEITKVDTAILKEDHVFPNKNIF